MAFAAFLVDESLSGFGFSCSSVSGELLQHCQSAVGWTDFTPSMPAVFLPGCLGHSRTARVADGTSLTIVLVNCLQSPRSEALKMRFAGGTDVARLRRNASLELAPVLGFSMRLHLHPQYRVARYWISRRSLQTIPPNRCMRGTAPLSTLRESHL